MHLLKRFRPALFLSAAWLLAQGVKDLSQGTGLLNNPLVAQSDSDGRIAKADEELKKAPLNPELLLAAGRTRDAQMQFTGSIQMYSKAISLAPGDVRFYRMRGHRYISLRRFQEAIGDMEKARALAPSSFEASYYLGLALYFNGSYNDAANEFARCVNMAGRPDEHAKSLPKGMPSCATLHQNVEFLVGMADWHYRALRRGGRADEARDVLKGVPNNQQIRDNVSSYRALLYYKGIYKESDALNGLEGGNHANAASGLALSYLLEGKAAAACGLWKKAATAQPWSSFGVISAEVELARSSRAACALFK